MHEKEQERASEGCAVIAHMHEPVSTKLLEVHVALNPKHNTTLSQE